MARLTPGQLDALETRLRPGGASQTGFLAPGQSLRDVLERDRHSLQRLGLSFAQVADRLELVLGRAERLLRLADRAGQRAGTDVDGARVVRVEPELQVRAWHFAGVQDCPFGDDQGHACPRQPWASGDYELTHSASGTKVRVPGLLPHLVRAHSFFEGDVPYHVDPVLLAQALTLDPGFRAQPQWRTERVWTMFSMTGALPWFGIGGPRWYWQSALMDTHGYGANGPPSRWDEEVEIAPAVSARRAGDWCVLVARKAATIAPGARIDGSDLAMSHEVGSGTFQLRRVEQKYVALDGE